MSYYIVKVYGLVCDGDGCEESAEAIPHIDAGRKLDQVRQQLAQPPDGWAFENGKDLCPKCKTIQNRR